MARIKFDLETYKAHPEKKVVTKEGLPVRILCTDRMDAHSDYVKKPIVALVLLKDKIQEQVVNYTKDGHLLTPGQEDGLDLFFADEEPKLSEFENAVMNCYTRDVSGKLLTQEELGTRAKKLLELAKKQLIPEFIATHYKEVQKAREEGKAEALKDIRNDVKKAKFVSGTDRDDEIEYRELLLFEGGKEYGKKEALKNLPRWKSHGAYIENPTLHFEPDNRALLSYRGRVIFIDDLEKLPGFKEE